MLSSQYRASKKVFKYKCNFSTRDFKATHGNTWLGEEQNNCYIKPLWWWIMISIENISKQIRFPMYAKGLGYVRTSGLQTFPTRTIVLLRSNPSSFPGMWTHKPKSPFSDFYFGSSSSKSAQRHLLDGCWRWGLPLMCRCAQKFVRVMFPFLSTQHFSVFVPHTYALPWTNNTLLSQA